MAAAAGAGSRWPGCACPACLPRDAPAAAVRDVAELLDIDVDQLAGPVPLIAADRHPGGPVQVRQPRAAVAAQDRVHRGGRQAQPEADPGRAQPLLTRRPTIRCSVRGGVRAGLAAAGTTGQPCPPCRLPVPGRPPGRGGVRDLEPFRGPAQRPASSTTHRARRSRPVSLSGALRWTTRTSWELGADCRDPHRTRRSSSIQDHPPVSPSPTSMGSTPRARSCPCWLVRSPAIAGRCRAPSTDPLGSCWSPPAQGLIGDRREGPDDLCRGGLGGSPS